jgi:hypothetical protein
LQRGCDLANTQTARHRRLTCPLRLSVARRDDGRLDVRRRRPSDLVEPTSIGGPPRFERGSRR